MKSFLIKITPKEDEKNGITDFSELDMYLANERNTYKEMVERERERDRETERKRQLLEYMLEG